MKWHTPPELAKRYRISPDKVVHWIVAGELIAVNVAKKLGGRPRYRISPEAVASFERKRSTSPRPKPAPRLRKQTANVIPFY